MLLLRCETSTLQSYLSMARRGRQRCILGGKKQVVGQLHIQSRQLMLKLYFSLSKAESLNIFPLNSLDQNA